MKLILANKDAMQYDVVEWDGTDVPKKTIIIQNGVKYKVIKILRIFDDCIISHVSIIS